MQRTKLSKLLKYFLLKSTIQCGSNKTDYATIKPSDMYACVYCVFKLNKMPSCLSNKYISANDRIVAATCTQ